MNRETAASMPWHLREASYSHHRKFDYLVELHRLTESWVRELQISRPAHSIDRGLDPEIADHLWMLESPAERGLSALLDDTSAEDVLIRLERTIWAAQAYTLGQLLERTVTSERSVLDSILEQLSWKQGRIFAEKRWNGLGDRTQENLRKLLPAFADTPFGAAPNSMSGASFLILRAMDDEAVTELHHCPHQSPYSEVLRIADELCAIHHHWVRGFAYGLHHRLQVTLQQGGGKGRRCSQRWHFAHGA